MVKVGLVVPCYNEEEALPRTAEVLRELFADLAAKHRIAPDSRVYFVDDGSTDGTWGVIQHLAARDSRIAGIKLSANVGHQNALLAGLMQSEGDVLVSMDADLQDDVGVLAVMLDEFAKGKEIVYAARKKRKTDSVWKRVTAHAFYRFLAVLGVRIVFNHADYRLMSRAAVEALRGFNEVNLFLRGMIPLLGFPSSVVYYERGTRTAGETKYPLRRMLSLAVDGVTSFSIVPLRFLFLVGFLVFFLSTAMSLWVLFAVFFNDMTVPGWASTTLPMYFLGGVQILAIGVIGEYTGKIYREVKRRPRYIVERCAGTSNDHPQ